MSGEDLRHLLEAVESGAVGDPPTVLAWVAGSSLALPPSELNEAIRRALLLLAAGGDPRRELDVDDRAVKALAADLYDDERRAELGVAIDALVHRVRDLPHLRDAALFLASDVELAWRLFALSLLAEELGA